LFPGALPVNVTEALDGVGTNANAARRNTVQSARGSTRMELIGIIAIIPSPLYVKRNARPPPAF
jgi:hypothetical protein